MEDAHKLSGCDSFLLICFIQYALHGDWLVLLLVSFESLPPSLLVRADSHNGYISDVDIYTGRDDSTETNLGAKVVKKLSQPLIGGNYHLYFDNLFSSVTLFDDLVEDGIYACGTFRKDRKGLPVVVKNTKLGMLYCYCNN